MLLADSREARELWECIVRRLTGNDEATVPDEAAPGGGALPIRVLVSEDVNPWELAERARDECAVDEPWERIGIPR